MIRAQTWDGCLRAGILELLDFMLRYPFWHFLSAFSTRIMLMSFCIRSLLTTISLISSIKWAEIQTRMNYYKGAPSTSRKRANCTSVRIEPRTKRQPCLNAAKNEREANDIYVLRQPSHPKSQDGHPISTPNTQSKPRAGPPAAHTRDISLMPEQPQPSVYLAVHDSRHTLSKRGVFTS